MTEPKTNTDPLRDFALDALENTATALRMLCDWQGLVGGRKLAERLKKPRPGDWVVETSTPFPAHRHPKRFGRLVAFIEGDSDYTHQWLLEHPDGTCTWWSNCQFATLVATNAESLAWVYFDRNTAKEVEQEKAEWVKAARERWAEAVANPPRPPMLALAITKTKDSVTITDVSDHG